MSHSNRGSTIELYGDRRWFVPRELKFQATTRRPANVAPVLHGTPGMLARSLTHYARGEESMLKSVIVAASMVLATAALAQGNTQKSGPGQSEFAPGQQPNTTKGPGHSESAPGQQPNKTGPGHSESAPGQQSTTGSSTNDRTKK